MNTGVELSTGPIQEAITEGLERHRGRRALVGGPAGLSYDELSAAIEAMARKLRTTLPGAAGHVGFCLENCPEYVTAYFGTIFAGHLPLLLDVNFNIGEIEAIRDDCGLDALVLSRGRVQALQGPPGGRGEQLRAFSLATPEPLSGDVVLLPLDRAREPRYRPRTDTQLCRFTSGTTGRPKCIEFSGRAVVAAARNWIRGTRMDAGDRTLCLAALSNGLAFNTSLLSTFLAGGELHFLKGVPLTRPVARRVEDCAITRLVAFPALYRNFVAAGGPDPASMASLRHAISAGAPLWGDVREEFRSRYGLDVSDYYGIAETGPCTFEREAGYHTGLGEPLPGVEVRIGPGAPEAGEAGEPETGEVLVRTESMASGYLNHPGLFEERLDEDGFYHSGDRGRIVDGRLYLVGRTQDHINVAGRKIDPTEVTAVVLDVEGVEDAVAFPDEDLNRETLVHLVVVASSPALTKRTLLEACRSRLAPYKVPGKVSFVDEIPRTGIGKPRLAVLREQLRPGDAS